MVDAEATDLERTVIPPKPEDSYGQQLVAVYGRFYIRAVGELGLLTQEELDALITCLLKEEVGAQESEAAERDRLHQILLSKYRYKPIEPLVFQSDK